MTEQELRDFVASHCSLETKELKQYKGYGIDKAWYVYENGKRFTKIPYFYLVSEDEDYIGEEYSTLADAKKFIDML